MNRLAIIPIVLLAACAEIEADPEVDVATYLETNGSTLARFDLHDEEVRSICECDTQECREAWVADHLGCDVCVTVLCPDADEALALPPGEELESLTGACVYCQPSIDEATEPCSEDSSTDRYRSSGSTDLDPCAP